MKKFRTLALCLLALVTVSFFVSCQFTLNDKQQKIYDGFIQGLLTAAEKSTDGVEPAAVATALKAANLLAKAQDFKIIDTNPDTRVKKEDTRRTLTLRFAVDKL